MAGVDVICTRCGGVIHDGRRELRSRDVSNPNRMKEPKP
jgi:hypothetical protein